MSQVCLDLENGIYHLYNRGVNKQHLFYDDEDRYFFLQLCAKATLCYGLSIYAFCLMGNHYHLFAGTPNENLSKSMKLIGESYAKLFLKKYRELGKHGRVFCGPYCRKLVQSELYAKVLLNYIHYNPVKDGFVAKPMDYSWSSCLSYVEKRDHFGFLDIETMKSYFDLQDYNPEWQPDNKKFAGLFLGDDSFVNKVSQKLFKNNAYYRKKLIPGKRRTLFVLPLEIDKFLNHFDLNARAKRDLMVFLLCEWSCMSTAEIAKLNQISESRIRGIKAKIKKKIEFGFDSDREIYQRFMNEVLLF